MRKSEIQCTSELHSFVCCAKGSSLSTIRCRHFILNEQKSNFVNRFVWRAATLNGMPTKNHFLNFIIFHRVVFLPWRARLVFINWLQFSVRIVMLLFTATTAVAIDAATFSSGYASVFDEFSVIIDLNKIHCISLKQKYVFLASFSQKYVFGGSSRTMAMPYNFGQRKFFSISFQLIKRTIHWRSTGSRKHTLLK